MIKITKLVIILTAALLLAWLLPWCYAFLIAAPERTPFTLYSCVTHSFASAGVNDDGKFEGRDFLGGIYDQRQFDSILPLFYSRQLASDGRFPAQIEGEDIDLRTAERSKFIFRTFPSEINRRRPAVSQLLESMPGRVDLESPEDVFRITDRAVEFVDMESNSLDPAKSSAFTTVFADKGFVFPARVVAGNPTTRKEYDNGVLIVDDASQLFHVKQMRGRPFVRKIDLPAGVSIGHAFVTEHADRKLLGLLSADDGRCYALGADYVLHELPIGQFDPATDGMMIVGDRFYWTVKIEDRTGAERLVAINARDYSGVDEHRFEHSSGVRERIAEYLFPFTLSFTSPLDGYVQPRVDDFSAHALWLGIVLGLGYVVLFRRTIRWRWPQIIGVVLLGLFLFIPLLVFEDRK